jgi:hypothetical protein
MTYTRREVKEAECFKCGRTAMCTIFVADAPEAETGYIDEFACCEDCEDILCK